MGVGREVAGWGGLLLIMQMVNFHLAQTNTGTAKAASFLPFSSHISPQQLFVGLKPF